MYYEIVPMSREHIPQIAQLEKLCFSAPWSEAMLEEELFNPQASFLAAEDEEGRTRQITRHWFQLSGRWGRMVRMPSRRVNPNNSSCTTR